MPQKKKIKMLKWILILCLVIQLCAATGILLLINNFNVQILLKGQPEIRFEYGTVFKDPGAIAVLQGRYFLKNGIDIPLHVEGNVDTGRLDTYTIHYTSDFLWLHNQKSRIVTIVDTEAPVISLVINGEPDPNKPYTEEGYSATDNCDGDLTQYVVRAEQPGKIIYWVTDSSGNVAQEERIIPLVDSEPPIIILKGEIDLHIPVGKEYEEPGYEAHDSVSGDITNRVTIKGDVEWTIPGTYSLIYSVEDDFGNHAESARTITIYSEPKPDVVIPKQKTIYLTFDDGPGPDTDRLLDVLSRYGVKATFFVVDTGYSAQMKRIVEEGHSIALHSVTHNYKQIYASREAYFADILGIQQIVKDATGVTTTLMRFPGGGSNMVSRFNPGIMSELTAAVQDAGFQYFDWNVDSNDAGGARTSEEVFKNVTEGVRQHKTSVVLQHDIHSFSVDAVERIIQWGLDNGYQFLPLKPNSYGAHHKVFN